VFGWKNFSAECLVLDLEPSAAEFSDFSMITLFSDFEVIYFVVRPRREPTTSTGDFEAFRTMQLVPLTAAFERSCLTDVFLDPR
jgi:hypothetical protein